MTREEAIKVLKKNRPGADPRRCGLELCTALDMAIAALREQPRWISVEERLPGESMYGKEFIVAIKNRFNESHAATMYWWGENQQAKTWTVWHDVTHWMPLPEPPEVEA